MRGTLVFALTCGLIACSPDKREPGSDDSDDTDVDEPIDAGDVGGIDARPSTFPDAAPEQEAFPADPIIEPGAPANAPELFEPTGPASGGPCLLEPPAGAMMPKLWLRPRFVASPVGNQNLFEWRLSTAGQTHELVVYTATPVWTMPKATWMLLNQQAVGQPINVSVRAARFNGTGLDAPAAGGLAGSFSIAPVAANGTIVYWTSGTNTTGGALKGFKVGDEGVTPVITATQAGVGCIGCHSSTPDGKYVAFDANAATQDGRPAWAELRSLDGTFSSPPWLSVSARNLLRRTYQHQPVFSAGHWTTGDRISLTMTELTPGKTDIVWTNLEATAETQGVGWGVVARTGDSGNAGASDFSHDGEKIVYVSAATVTSGINLDNGGGDLWIVPYNDGAGGLAERLAGGSATDASESYPTFSADDKLIAFTRVPPVGPNYGSYNNAKSEVWAVPSAGGTSLRIAGNDPATCSNKVSPGVMNSWPKWSPKVTSQDGVEYYFVTFASTRGDGFTPQLYVAAITVDAQGTVASYPALHLWNQPSTEHNHTPAWDTFEIIVE